MLKSSTFCIYTVCILSTLCSCYVIYYLQLVYIISTHCLRYIYNVSTTYLPHVYCIMSTPCIQLYVLYIYIYIYIYVYIYKYVLLVYIRPKCVNIHSHVIVFSEHYKSIYSMLYAPNALSFARMLDLDSFSQPNSNQDNTSAPH